MINSRFHDPGVGATGANAGFGFADKSYNLSFQIQVHNQKYLELESQSLAEHFYFLRRMLNYLNPDQDACSITYEQYATNTFIIGITFEKLNEANMTGINTKMSGLITTKVKPYKTLTTDEQIQELFLHVISESVAELRSDGVVVFD